MTWSLLNRKIHYWGAIACAVPVLVVIVTGILLLVKKEVSWIQPPTQAGQGEVPQVAFEQILRATQAVPQAKINSWADIDRLDIRPGKGVIKVLAKNQWEVQLDQQTGQVLQVAYRRSDLIESLHDGSFFHDQVKLWIFLPSALVLLVLWVTGLWLFLLPLIVKWRRKRRAV